MDAGRFIRRQRRYQLATLRVTALEYAIAEVGINARTRVHRAVLALVLAFAVDGAGRCHYYPLDRFAALHAVADQVEEQRSSTYVDVDIAVDLIHGLTRAGLSRKVDHHVLAGQNLQPVLTLADVAPDHHDVRGQRRQQRRVLWTVAMDLGG